METITKTIEAKMQEAQADYVMIFSAMRYKNTPEWVSATTALAKADGGNAMYAAIALRECKAYVLANHEEALEVIQARIEKRAEMAKVAVNPDAIWH